MILSHLLKGDWLTRNSAKQGQVLSFEGGEEDVICQITPNFAREISCCKTLNTEVSYDAMNNFGETIRALRVAQDLGLRETATKVGISPAYLSRIERGKERPPKPDVIKALARLLAADPDVLFRLSSSTDPEVVNYLHDQPEVMNLLRYIKEAGFTDYEIKDLIQIAESIKARPLAPAIV